ncbi:hypothetical protein DYB37_010393 [Aphanomyces astaci]|uniref:Uncharacterized protein n=2 Tax=Aphanomyces astaci TaxID=112090 RepID=A0A397F1P0_APHAT|nr:hypothetical protein DYB34_006445 [Aphanomyces astaci]RHY71596.1 hypothetical protein DYB30_007500 [Aphanomyces astaci]RHY92606.1 hypothetical protein DYB35_003962 [Aphanomyces astaci]RHZ07619.1 hypothetical protein DYB31_006631 [Aphanomyces astaci]RHZ12209.1 hypothetical protein DYB37_010393 [Aphanomyces astaci]
MSTSLGHYGAVSLDIKKAHETSNKPARSAVAHSLILQQEAGEARCIPEAASQKVQLAITSSIIINVILAIAKTYAAITSGSLAVLSSLVDSILDLTSQGLFWFSDRYMHTPNAKYPAGRRRLEPIAVVVSATLMGMAALEVVQKSVTTLIEGFGGQLPELDMSIPTVAVLGIAIIVKLMLWFLCGQIAYVSPSAAALAQDHRNDVFSNAVAVTTSLVAHYNSELWYFDSIGAIAISIYITLSWVATGKEQVERLVGLQADQDFIDRVRTIADAHHPKLQSDIIRAYHFGNNFLVELEVVLPKDMSVQESHDISLALQIKVEALDEVERAFVHVDYQSRDYDEHKDPTARLD